MSQTRAEFLNIIENLQARAEAAEDALRAIQSGEVDALVISGVDGDRVYTLEGADQTYRMMVEKVQEGVATLQADGMVLYANQRLAEMLCVPLEQLLGATLLPFIPPADQKRFLGLLNRGIQGVGKAEMTLHHRDGSSLPALLTFSAVENQGTRMICLVATDLTEQKHHEEILAAERLARSILEQASEAIVVCDRQGTIIRASQATFELIPGNPLYQSFEIAFPLELSANEPSGERFSIGAVLNGRSIRGAESCLKAPGGSELLVSATPLHADNGEILGCIVSLTDISHLKQMEQALRESELRLQIATQAARLGIHDYDIRANSINWDTRVRELWGVPPDQPITYEVFQNAIHPDDRAATQAAVDQALDPAGTGEYYAEYRVISQRDGIERWIAASGLVISEQGQAIRLIGTVQDITERKRAEEALQASEERFRGIVETAEEGIALHEPDGTIAYVNRRMAEMLGYAAEEILGKSSLDFVDDDQKQVVIQAREKLREQRSLEAERKLLRKDGSTLWTLCNISPRRDGEGSFRGYLAMHTDITERKRTELQVVQDKARLELQRRLLEQREQERQGIARDLHDGPVQDLTGATFAIQMMLDDSPPAIAEQLATIQKTLQAQIGELRAYAGELRPPTLAKFGLVKAIQSHLDTYQEKHPEMIFQFEEEWNGPLLPEETSLGLFRIYQEALTNLAKHSQATQVTIRVVRDQQQARLEILDNGVGFEVPDDWLDLAQRRHLGLVGMRERAEAIGGKLEIHSKLRGGTTLFVTVPLKDHAGSGEVS